MLVNNEVVGNMIKEEDGKFFVYSKDGSKKLSKGYSTKEEAKKRLGEIEYFKNNQFQSITCNFIGQTRYDTLEGREYLVAPMVILVEGVHQGTNGRLFYPKEELSKTPVVWNHKPIVVYHPTDESGNPLSACEPSVIDSRKIGLMMNTVNWKVKVQNKEGKTVSLPALKSEAWLEVNRVKEIDSRVLEAIEKNEKMELSTGVFTDNEYNEGDWEGPRGTEHYEAIARNYRPDHLALLPDQKGACSIADGAGLLANSSDVGLNEKRNLLQSYINKKDKTAWVDDVFDDYFIYQSNGTTYKQNYTVDKQGAVKTEGIPEEVVRVVQYKKKILTNGLLEVHYMNKKELVDKIIANRVGQFGEDDRPALMAMEEKVLAKMLPIENAADAAAKKKKEEEEAAAAAEAEKKKKEKEANNSAVITGNADKGNQVKQTADEFINNAPPEVAEILRNGQDALKSEKTKLIAVITANEQNPYSKEQLNVMSLPDLRNIAILARPKPKPGQEVFEANYAGQGDTFVENEDTTDSPLAVPVVNFEANKEDKK